MDHRNDRFSFDALEDLDTMVEIFQQVALKDGSETMVLDQETRCGWVGSAPSVPRLF